MKTKRMILAFGFLGLAACGGAGKNKDLAGKTEFSNKPGQTSTTACSPTDKLNVELMGVIVRDGDQGVQLDNRIRVAADNSSRSQTTSPNVSELDKKSLEETTALNTYINLGCKNLADEDIKGLFLERVKVGQDSVLTLKASKIFVCASQRAPRPIMNLIANQITFNNTTFSIEDGKGKFVVAANDLRLIGTNTLVTQTRTNTSTAALTSLTVAKSIEGTGQLLIRSKVAGCVLQ